MSARLPFNPSLNLTVLADLPGLPRGAAGSSANHWLCSWSVGQRMAASPGILAAARHDVPAVAGLVALPTVEAQPTATWDLIAAAAPWPAALDALVAQRNPEAEALADDLGRVLGGLVATLVLTSRQTRSTRPDWPAAHWDTWARVRHVAVGGGLVAGLLGTRMLAAAAAWLAERRVPARVGLARRPASLVVRGAAVGDLDDGLAPGLVVDWGGTTVKRAVLVDGDLVARPPVPAPAVGRPATALLEQLTRTIVEIVPPGDEPLAVAAAIATYVDSTGQPYAGQLGPYASLGSVDLVGELRRRVRASLRRDVTIRVRHDGASALLGARRDDPCADAVIVLGTAIGHALDPVVRADAV